MRAVLVCLAACNRSETAARPPPAPFTLQSSDIRADGRFSPETGCHGSRTPAISWQGLPERTVSLAIVVSSNSDAGEMVHWTAWDIDPESAGLGPGIRPTQTPPLQGRTGTGKVGWTALCGLADDAVVRVDAAALDSAVLPPPTVSAKGLRARLAPHLIGLARLEALAPVPEAGPSQ